MSSNDTKVDNSKKGLKTSKVSTRRKNMKQKKNTSKNTISDFNSVKPQKLIKALNRMSEDQIAKMPKDIVHKLRKTLNPYGRTIEGADNFLNFSATNLREEYLIRLIVTSFVAYLNRMCDEWEVPDDVPVVPVHEYLRNPESVKPKPLANGKEMAPKIRKAYKENEQKMKKRVIVKEFLEDFLQFDPNKHVRSAYKPNFDDPEREFVDTDAGKLAVEHREKVMKDHDFKRGRKKHELKQKSKKTEKVVRYIKDKNGKKKPIKIDVPISKLKRKRNKKKISYNKVSRGAKDDMIDQNTTEMIPPADTYARFKRYMAAHYEELRDVLAENKFCILKDYLEDPNNDLRNRLGKVAYGKLYNYLSKHEKVLKLHVKDLYCYKPDLELALNPYSWHKTRQEAEDFKKKHRNEVITDVITAHSGKWNFYGPFKAVRERMNFYNDKTMVLESIMTQLEEDAKTGADLMRKRTREKKNKNIKQEGADDPTVKKWLGRNSSLADMGAEHINKDDDLSKLQVDVFTVSKGGTDIQKDYFETEAVPPESAT